MLLSPSELDFPPDTITIQNIGTGADLVISNITFGGTSAAAFTVIGNTCGSGVKAGSSCTIQVGFSDAPATGCGAGEFCAVMNIFDNAADGQQTVTLHSIASIL